MEAPYWLSYGQFGSGQHFGRGTDTQDSPLYISKMYEVGQFVMTQATSYTDGVIGNYLIIFQTTNFG